MFLTSVTVFQIYCSLRVCARRRFYVKKGMIIIAIVLCVCIAIPIGILVSKANKESKYNLEVELEVVNPHTAKLGFLCLFIALFSRFRYERDTLTASCLHCLHILQTRLWSFMCQSSFITMVTKFL